MKLHADGWARNWLTIKRQWNAYTSELKAVVFPELWEAVKDRDIPETVHKVHAIVEEAFDKMPRVWSYLFWVGVIVWLL